MITKSESSPDFLLIIIFHDIYSNVVQKQRSNYAKIVLITAAQLQQLKCNCMIRGGKRVELKEKIKELPASPGVYLMKDSPGSTIYVGKSKNLKSRVSSYFQSSKAHSPKVVKLVRNIKDFDYMLTDTEFEAFMLECKLIREIKPFYNKLLKSPRSYTYIKISIGEKYPTIEISGESDNNDRSLYFGPYTSKNTVERGLQSIKEYFRILCAGSPQRPSPCLNHSLGLCIGVCLDSTSREQYLSIVDKIIRLLSGTDKSLLEAMEASMDNAAEKLDFEKAAKLRDYIGAVSYLVGKAKVVEYTKENKNIVVVEPLEDDSLKLFLIKGNKVLFSEKYSTAACDFEKLRLVLKDNILTHFNNTTEDKAIQIKKEDIDEAQIIYSYLNSKSSSCKHVTIPQKWLNESIGKNLDTAINRLFIAIKL